MPLLLACSSCGGDANAPDDTFTGRYVLETADGAELPFVVFTNPLEETANEVLTDGSITVQSRGRILDVRSFELGAVTSSRPTATDSTFLSFTWRGAALFVGRPRINPDQSHVDSGSVSGDMVTLFVRYVAPHDAAPRSATLTYRRAP